MEGRGVFLRVGFLIVVGVALLIGIIWFLGGRQFTRGTLFETYFRESVQGLEQGAPVKYRGVTVGRVTFIGLVSAEYGRSPRDIDRSMYRQVLVRYLVDIAKIGPMPNLDKAVALGLRARVVSSVITGVAYIELDFVNPRLYPVEKPPWTPQAQFIPSVPSTFAQVQNAAQQLLARLNQIDLEGLAAAIQGLVGDLRTSLRSGDVHRTLAAAQRLLDTLNTAVKQADLPGLTADLKQTSASLRGVAESPDLRKLLANGALASGRLAALTARLATLTSSLETTSRQASAGVTNLQAGIAPILRNLQATSQNLRELTGALRSYPGQILAPPPPAPEQAR